MKKHSRFVLVSPASFYACRQTYTCTSCGHSFTIDNGATQQQLDDAFAAHECTPSISRTVTSTFPVLRLLKDRKV